MKYNVMILSQYNNMIANFKSLIKILENNVGYDQ